MKVAVEEFSASKEKNIFFFKSKAKLSKYLEKTCS